jgi:anti-sigma factor RsiW
VERERAKELLSDYLEGELSAAEEQALERLLSQDAELRAELHELRRIMDALGGLRPVAPSEDFMQQVQQKIRRRQKSPFDFAFGLDRKIPFEAISMVLIGILLALYLLLVVLPREHLDESAVSPPHRIEQDAGARPDGGAVDGAASVLPSPRRTRARPGLDVPRRRGPPERGVR